MAHTRLVFFSAITLLDGRKRKKSWKIGMGWVEKDLDTIRGARIVAFTEEEAEE